MIVTLRTERIRTIEQVAAFVAANGPVDFQPLDRDGAYAFVARTLARLGYRALDKPSKALARRYLAKTTGCSRAQLTRLIRQHRETAKVVDRRDGNQGRPFARVYTPADVRLLAQVDEDSRAACRFEARRSRSCRLRSTLASPARFAVAHSRLYSRSLASSLNGIRPF